MNIARLLISTVFLFSFSYLEAQNTKKQSDLIDDLLSGDTTVYKVTNTDFLSKTDLHSYAITKLGNIIPLEDSLIIINRKVIISNCRFENGLDLKHFWFKKGLRIETSGLMPDAFEGQLVIWNFDSIRINKGLTIIINKGNVPIELSIKRSKLNDGLNLLVKDDGITSLVGCEIYLPKTIRTDGWPHSFWIHSEALYLNLDSNTFRFKESEGNLYVNSENFYFNSNTFTNVDDSTVVPSLTINVLERVKSFTLTNNIINTDLSLNLGQTIQSLKLYYNQFQKLGMGVFRIPTEDNKILWNDISSSRLGILTEDYGRTKPYYTGKSEEQIADLLTYKTFLKFYKKFFDEFKTSGDIVSANQVYIAIKDLELAQLKYGYSRNPSLDQYLRIKLNQLLKFYTLYGTDPVRAAIISIYIILLFSAFYFFFPSTWDIQAKSRLIENFRKVVRSNKKGISRQIFVLIGGFMLSLLNAITLSLNSFVTLGFGEIPTKGLARYITILQGFIGWFLLSLFIVSLVSQILF